jgi:hypothetical protein
MKTKILLGLVLLGCLSYAGCGGCGIYCDSRRVDQGGLTPVFPDDFVRVHFWYTFENDPQGRINLRETEADKAGCIFLPTGRDAITGQKRCPGPGELNVVGEEVLGFDDGIFFSFPLQWLDQDPALGHVIGRSDGDGWSATVGWDSPNYLQYGPYTNTVPVGPNTAVWALEIDNNTADNWGMVTLDVNDATTQEQLAVRTVTRREWTSTNTYQYFTVPFYVDQSRAGHQFEFRVYWHGLAYVNAGGCGFAHMDWTASDWQLGHQLGRQDWNYSSGWDAWSTGWSDGGGWFQYGPYTNKVVTGNNVALWNLMIDDHTSDDNIIVYLDVYDDTTATVLASTQLTRRQWISANAYQTFGLPFTVDSSRSGHQFEFRVYSYDTANYLNLQSVGVMQPPQN